MSITRWDPVRELEDMSTRLNRLFGRSEPGREAIASSDWSPAVDVLETPEEFLIKVDCPEVNKDDIKVSVEQGMLRISGERKQEREEKNKRFHRVERFYGSFARSFTLPDNVDESKLRAECKDGLLSVHLPKTEKSKPKAVEVKVS